MHETPISQFVSPADRFPGEIRPLSPWQIIGQIEALIQQALDGLPNDFRRAGQIAVHRSADVAESALLAGPVIISAGVPDRPGLAAPRRNVAGRGRDGRSALRDQGIADLHALGGCVITFPLDASNDSS
jgi:hypothetical protein